METKEETKETQKPEYYKEYRKNSSTLWAYSVQRMDLLIVSISGGGLYVVLETLKTSLTSPFALIWMLKTSGAIFVAALMANFISQTTGEAVHRNEIRWADEKLDRDDVKAKEFETKSGLYSRATHALNIASMLLMLIGISLLISYFFITF
jgi:hypothetical protein